MGAVAHQPRRPRGSGSIQWKHGRPYAVFRDLITGRPKWEGFDSEEEADAFLTQRGYILRRVSGYGFPNALRMTVGTEDANRGVVAALTEFLGR